MGKDEFKGFVRNHPNLANYVIDNKMTWQQFYELYDLYGEDNSIWNNFNDNTSNNNIINNSTNVINTFKDFFTLFKGIDLNNVQKTLTSLDKAIDAFKGISTRNDNENNNYEERPKYKYFED